MRESLYKYYYLSLQQSNTNPIRPYIVVTNDKKVVKCLNNHSKGTVGRPLMPFLKWKRYILSKIGVFEVPFYLSDTIKQHSQSVDTPNTSISLPSPLPVRSVASNISYPQHTYNENTSIYSKNELITYVTVSRNVQGWSNKKSIFSRNKKDILGLSDTNKDNNGYVCMSLISNTNKYIKNKNHYIVMRVDDKVIMLLRGVELLW